MPRPSGPQADPEALRATIERALHREDEPGAVIPMLERLQTIAVDGSDHRRFADRRLAALLLEDDPWRAAIYIRRLIERPGGDEEDAHFALMGLAQALLGNHQFAARAYRKALAIDPNNPWYSHNLGHLLDVALDRPKEALEHLELAHKRLPHAIAIACSYVHALFRSGRLDEARTVLRPLTLSHGYDPDVWALATQLDREQAARKKRRSKRKPENTKR